MVPNRHGLSQDLSIVTSGYIAAAGGNQGELKYETFMVQLGEGVVLLLIYLTCSAIGLLRLATSVKT